ncbi:Phosphatidylinositol-4-phosphate 5-kinase, putative [Giardia lamblia P15]|uniref:Phosphatidylinositol-4-phosphate 5-kinase, putative n=1 Tax=Giardia intestinalis (strain P15) TaxID=658858 RepID=E1EZM3_GIAIA|nr:Phosphatidylinositol-4-phosphate 5-kinase, putative [Giardia lamblia P15]
MRASLSTGNIDPMKNLTSVRAVFSPDGSAYKGTWYNSLRHGQGTHVYPNGDCYTGEWAFNLPQGYGEFYTCLEPRPGKSVKKVIPDDPASCPTLMLTYAGYWDRGERHHFGKYYYSPNERYEGMWHQGLRSGFGCHFYPETLQPSNLLLSREEHLKQLEKVANNALAQKHIVVHSDLFRSNTKKGVSRPSQYKKITVKSSKFPFGCIYKGMWNADRRHGLGRVIFPNGDVFIGTFSSDYAYGIGVRYSVDSRTVMQGFYDERGQCVCSQVRSGFTAEDLKIVLAVWTEPCAPYVGINETVRSIIRTALYQDGEFSKLCSTAGGSIVANSRPLQFTDVTISALGNDGEEPLDNTIGVPGVQYANEQMGADSVIFHQGKAFSPQRRIPELISYQGGLLSPAKVCTNTGNSFAVPGKIKITGTTATDQDVESGLYSEVLQRASSKLSDKVGSEYDALESAFMAKMNASKIPVNRTDAGIESVLSNYSAQEYPYLYQPDDSEFDIEGIKTNINNLMKMARKLPIGCASDRTEVDKLLDLPLESDFKYFPESKLINGDLVILETLRSLVNVE